MKDKNYRIAAAFVVFGILWILFLVLNIFVGSAEISAAQTIDFLLGKGIDKTAESILWKIRIPRTLSAMLLGGALAMSGYLLQTFFHNPIAGPFVLGVSSGAKLVVALAMIFAASRMIALNSLVMIAAAFLGALASLGLVLLISEKVGGMSLLVVCGVMIGYICSAVTDFVVTFADDADIVNLHNWSKGSFSGMRMENVGTIFVVVMISFLAAVLLSKPISAYRLGENFAKNSGVDVKKLRVMLILLSGLLSACVTAFAGPVSFVGIAVPHIVLFAFKTGKPIVLIPACFLGGGIFCMVCDMIARTVFSPTELSISTVTAIFGSPIVIAVMLRRKRQEL